MTRCQFCGAWNAEDEHHCGLCGREPSGQPALARRVSANPLPARAAEPPKTPPARRTPDRTRPPGAARRAAPAGKVIPFESIAPERLPAPEPPPERRPRGPRPSPRTAGPRPQEPTRQASLPFPPQTVTPAPLPMREAQVAPLERRFSAAAFDTSLVLLVLAFFAVTFYVLGGEVHVSLRAALPWVGFGLILDLAYRIVLCVLRADSVGMHFAHLRLVNFDGQDAEPAQRWIRLVAACLSVAAAGLGLLWALFDEEKLTWHDQISKTFPTPDDQPVSRPRRP